jgi:predicted transposase YdaD
MAKPKKTTRGTDETFLKLMTLSGSSILKLLGVPSAKAEKYHFRAVTLKEKRMEPDVEGIPMLKSEKGLIFIEFQSYWDPFIRYRLVASVFQGCTQQKNKEQVIAGIVYTDKDYKTAALPLSKIMGAEDCQDWFKEIVLTDYTETELLSIDPKLIVLAPFTLDTETEKAEVIEKGNEWAHQVGQVFHLSQQQEALDILGLFVLNRFRQLQYEEVIAMLNFDLMDSVAGQQVYDMGHQKGIQKGVIEDAREMVLEVLDERFGIIPGDMIQQVRVISLREHLKELHRQAIRCSDLESFKEMLSKALSFTKE